METGRSGKHTVPLKAGWKQSDFSWRGSMWNTPPTFAIYVLMLVTKWLITDVGGLAEPMV